MSNIYTASAQYATRPADERYPSLQALIDSSLQDQNHSAERVYNLKDLSAQPSPDGRDVHLVSPAGKPATFTHWAFSQLCRTIKAPSGYLATLPPELASRNINHGLSVSPVGTSANVLVRMPNGSPLPIVRACTSETYGRVWDAALYDGAQQSVFNARSTGSGSQWKTPPTWDGQPAGVYKGDRDSFVIMVDGGSIVDNPSQGFKSDGRGGDMSRGRPMYRGIMMRNSEVGASGIVIDSILFDFVCGNHILWGAVIDKAYRRRHVGKRVLRDVLTELGRLAYRWTHRSASQDAQLIQLLMSHEIATSREALIDELMAMGATKEQATEAYDKCESTESASPRSSWGIAAGLTRISQETEYQDARFALDKLASQVLQRGRKLVAA